MLKGKVHKFGDDIDTDIIIPGKYLKEFESKELSKHIMEGIDVNFAKKVKEGDFIVAGKNFGCGSSREHAPLALKHAGIKAVLALSFARIFYRNAIDGGFLLPIEISNEAYSSIDDGDEIKLDIENGIVKNLTKNKEFKIKPFPNIVKEIINAGGLFYYKPKD